GVGLRDRKAGDLLEDRLVGGAARARKVALAPVVTAASAVVGRSRGLMTHAVVGRIVGVLPVPHDPRVAGQAPRRIVDRDDQLDVLRVLDANGIPALAGRASRAMVDEDPTAVVLRGVAQLIAAADLSPVAALTTVVEPRPIEPADLDEAQPHPRLLSLPRSDIASVLAADAFAALHRRDDTTGHEQSDDRSPPRSRQRDAAIALPAGDRVRAGVAGRLASLVSRRRQTGRSLALVELPQRAGQLEASLGQQQRRDGTRLANGQRPLEILASLVGPTELDQCGADVL